MSAVPILPTRSAAETTVVESNPIALTTSQTDAVVVAAASSGPYQAADVWFECDDGWLGTDENVRVRLMGRVRGVNVFLGEATLANAIKSVSSGTATGLAMFSRGVEVDGFEAVVQRSGGGSNLSGGRFILRAGREAGPIGLSLGEVAGTIVTVFGGVISVKPDARAGYSGSTNALIGSGTSGTKSILYVHHPSSEDEKKYELRRVVVSYLAGTGTGTARIRVAKFTTENGTPGGSSGTTSAMDGDDASSGATVLQGANAPSGRSDLTGIVVPVASSGSWEWSPGPSGKPVVLRSAVAEGVEVRVELSGTVSAEMQFDVSIEWLES